MKNIYQIVVTVFLIQAHMCFADEQNVGLFDKGENEICVAFEKVVPKHGDVVTLVSTEQSDPVIKAKIDANPVNCKHLEKALISGPYYKIVGVNISETPNIGFAILGSGKTTKEGGVIAWHSENAEKTIYLRSCASSEGLHFSVWESPKIVGHAKWHQYFYLGYDLDPDCAESEVE